MSYKFNIDHSIPISDLHDMISIDIYPETRSIINGPNIEIHGYLTFVGSYLTNTLGEAGFEGSMPIDITLPYRGGSAEISPEISAFDYSINENDSLFLGLEINLSGYEYSEERPSVMDALIEPYEEIEEEYIEEFEEFSEYPQINEESLQQPSYYEDFDLPQEYLENQCDDNPHDEIEENHSELIDEDIEIISDNKDNQFEIEEVLTTIAELTLEEMEIEDDIPLYESELSMSDIPYSPLVASNQNINNVEFTSFYDDNVEFYQPTEIGRDEKNYSDGISGLMDELFDMKKEVARKKAFRKQQEEELRIEEEEKFVCPRPKQPYISNLARHFDEKNTTIKMVYVEKESDTLGQVLERYTSKMDDVWNLNTISDGVKVGDCVMLKYEKT